MKKVLKDENQDLNNIQKLSYITTYNPYYKIEKKKEMKKKKKKKIVILKKPMFAFLIYLN